MAMIAPRYSTTRAFYTSRFLRIFVPYWAVAGAIIVCSVALGLASQNWASLTPYFDQSQHNGSAGLLIAATSNLTLFGQDLVMFLQDDVGLGLSFTANFRDSSTPLYPYLIIPQAWSVAVELTFYLMVPWLARRHTRTIIVLIILSLVARLFSFDVLHLKHDPWNYRFFPFEFLSFGLGMLSWRLCARLPESWKNRLRGPTQLSAMGYLGFATGMILLMHVIWSLNQLLTSPLGYQMAQTVSSSVWFGLLPPLFLISRNHRFDRRIGELSFPIYLVHLFIYERIETSSMVASLGLSAAGLGAIGAVITITVSIALTKFLITPLDRMRYAAASRWGVVKAPPQNDS
jgi:peptidoglycan/LPS O-acetylase OafA/YrhL